MIETSKIELPKGSYDFRVVKVQRGISQKQQPKVDVDLELINNGDVKLKDEDGNVVVQSPNGLQVRTWLSEQVQSLGSLNNFLRALGLKPITEPELTTWNVDSMLGQVGCGIAYGKAKPNLDSEGQPIVNKYTGKAVTIAENRFTEFFPKPV